MGNKMNKHIKSVDQYLEFALTDLTGMSEYVKQTKTELDALRLELELAKKELVNLKNPEEQPVKRETKDGSLYQNNILYPLTILNDRYKGKYSGGKFTAWNLEPEQIPYEVSARDNVRCKRVWKDIHNTEIPIGYGRTVEEAIMDLEQKIDKMFDDDSYSKWFDITYRHDSWIGIAKEYLGNDYNPFD